MTDLKPYKPYIIGGVAMLLTAGALALVLIGHGPGAASGPEANLAIPIADKTPAHHATAKGAEAKPLEHMQLQAQYAGPLKDTVIQRWRDPVDGTICYLYLPILVQHSPPTPMGLVQYGANGIGSISCLPGH